MSRETLTITDNRSGETFEVPIENGAVRASDLTTPFDRPEGPGLVIYDPGFQHTASCHSAITNIELIPGLLEHRGYPIEELAEHSSFVEVAYLLIHGELPTEAQFDEWKSELSSRKFVHENLKTFITGFQYDAPPMAMLAAAVGALGAFYQDAWDVGHEEPRHLQTLRLISKMPTLAAYAFRHGTGRPFVYPTDGVPYSDNLLSMLFKMSELEYTADPAVTRALDSLLIVHADHEQSAATTAVRAVGSSYADPYAAVAAGVYSLSGPPRGRADADALHMLREIETPDKVTAYLTAMKESGEKIQGLGHWIYRSPDPRAAILRRRLDELAEVHTASPLLAVADELARQVVEDDYFTSRGIYPNVDLYSGLTYEAIGIPEEMFGVMFALARSAGWVAQWNEMVVDPEQTTVRPRQLYVGPARRAYVPLDQR
jgi:citrate synthase